MSTTNIPILTPVPARAQNNNRGGGEDAPKHVASPAASAVREVALQLERCRRRAARVHAAAPLR